MSQDHAESLPTQVSSAPRTLKLFAAFAALVVLAFAGTLVELARLSLGDSLASHTLLIPLVSVYLAWLRRDQLAGAPAGARWPAVVPAIAGVALLGPSTSPEDQVAVRVLSLCCFLWAGGFALLGARTMRAFAFPALFLVFTAPLTAGAVAAIETFFQHTSAEVAFRFIQWSGTLVYREGLTFTMPGVSIMVGPECSGIRSSFVLFITSLLAGHLFLRTAWKRWFLALFVIPLGIVRNAFRVFVLAMLSVHVDPSYLDSPIHHSGGPIFFALSLIPFFLVLLWLRRGE
jgi:exosortase C (VPDSG-CTERM-specific)